MSFRSYVRKVNMTDPGIVGVYVRQKGDKSLLNGYDVTFLMAGNNFNETNVVILPQLEPKSTSLSCPAVSKGLSPSVSFGNSWGCDAQGCALGHGDAQEEFYGCSDVRILPRGVTPPQTSTARPATRQPTVRPTKFPLRPSGKEYTVWTLVEIIRKFDLVSRTFDLSETNDDLDLDDVIPLNISGQDFLQMIVTFRNQAKLPFMHLLLQVCILFQFHFVVILGHGRLLDPPSRMSAWRAGFNVPINYDDQGMNCGSVGTQWGQNGGKCGICGDSWSGTRFYERPNGPMVQHNIITKKYYENSVINISLQLTANHKGWNEFRICDIAKSGGIEASQACLDGNVLRNQSGSTRLYFPSEKTGFFNFVLQLPRGMTCAHCLLQWRWKTGHSWGCDQFGCGIGRGEEHEEFYGCSDVTILPKGSTTAMPIEGQAQGSRTTSRWVTKSTTRRPVKFIDRSSSLQDIILSNNLHGNVFVSTDEVNGPDVDIPLDIGGQDYLEMLLRIYNSTQAD
ncbi:hypothetical protein Btru_016289 [Bulinus truncatus]|nr:hypothetical protein Btru_016289 [Bulinus truncatus]